MSMNQKQSNSEELRFSTVLTKIGFYSLAGISGIFIIPTLTICAPVFMICGVACPLLGLIKMLDSSLQLGIPFAENIIVMSGVENPFISFFFCVVVGIGLLWAGRICWKLLLGYFRRVRKMKERLLI